MDGTVEKCKRNGWKAGTWLVGNEGYGPTIIRITAIGEEGILAIEVSHNGETSDGYEGDWTLMHRRWKQIKPFVVL